VNSNMVFEANLSVVLELMGPDNYPLSEIERMLAVLKWELDVDLALSGHAKLTKVEDIRHNDAAGYEVAVVFDVQLRPFDEADAESWEFSWHDTGEFLSFDAKMPDDWEITGQRSLHVI